MFSVYNFFSTLQNNLNPNLYVHYCLYIVQLCFEKKLWRNILFQNVPTIHLNNCLWQINRIIRYIGSDQKIWDLMTQILCCSYWTILDKKYTKIIHYFGHSGTGGLRNVALLSIILFLNKNKILNRNMKYWWVRVLIGVEVNQS